MLGQLKGYSFGDDRKSKVAHNFFVDDLKLFASNKIDIKKLLDLVTTFSRDICMDFGIDKCAYMKVVKGKQVSNLQSLEMNDTVMQPIEEGDTYKYLGQDENINFDGPINKERVTKEYFTRVRKIWPSELSAYNKDIAHNSFALSVLIPTFGIIDWSIQDIKDLDIKTRKQLTMSGNFHPNSDIDLLYIQRNLGGRGLRQIQRVFESLIISIRQYLLRNRNRNMNIAYICDEEKDKLLRVGENLLQTYEIETNLNQNPKTVSKLYAKADMKAQSTKLERDVI